MALTTAMRAHSSNQLIKKTLICAEFFSHTMSGVYILVYSICN